MTSDYTARETWAIKGLAVLVGVLGINFLYGAVVFAAGALQTNFMVVVGTLVLAPMGCYCCWVAWRVVRRFSAPSLRHLCITIAIYVYTISAVRSAVEKVWGRNTFIPMAAIAIATYLVSLKVLIKRPPANGNVNRRTQTDRPSVSVQDGS